MNPPHTIGVHADDDKEAPIPDAAPDTPSVNKTSSNGHDSQFSSQLLDVHNSLAESLCLAAKQVEEAQRLLQEKRGLSQCLREAADVDNNGLSKNGHEHKQSCTEADGLPEHSHTGIVKDQLIPQIDQAKKVTFGETAIGETRSTSIRSSRRSSTGDGRSASGRRTKVSFAVSATDEDECPSANVKKKKMLLSDEDERLNIKKNVKEAIKGLQYDVCSFYHTSGYSQQVARSAWFENATMFAIAANAVWIPIDVDFNHANFLFEADPIFQIFEHAFCAYFTTEWVVRFAAFRTKSDGFKDRWFAFDSVLVFLMVLDTWVMNTVFFILSGKSGGNMIEVSFLRVFRLLRLVRVARMVKLFRAAPEMLVMIKSILGAMRSVFFTVILLFFVIYILGIFFRVISKDTVLEKQLFGSTVQSCATLLIDGLFPAWRPTVDVMDKVSTLYSLLFIFFSLWVTLTMMNMLIGVLVEVVKVASVVEKERIDVEFMTEFVLAEAQAVGCHPDQDGSIFLSRVELEELLGTKSVVKNLISMRVDPSAITNYIEMLFAESHVCEIGDFLEVMLNLREGNACTVRDIQELRKYLNTEMGHLRNYLSGVGAARLRKSPCSSKIELRDSPGPREADPLLLS